MFLQDTESGVNSKLGHKKVAICILGGGGLSNLPGLYMKEFST